MGAETYPTQSPEHEVIPKYDISELKIFSPVGRGAKGVVFHTRTENSKDDLALKVVLKSSMRKHRNGAAESIGLEQSRVYFEQQILREFDHPLLPRLRGVFETENLFGYAIDYCSGGNLSLLRKQQVEKMFSDDIIRFYAAEMIIALEYLHTKGIVYRDLKPDNILIQDNGHLMLVDFDLSTKLVPVSSPNRSSFDSGTKLELDKQRTRRRRPQFSDLYSFCKSGIPKSYSVDSGRKSGDSIESSESESVGKSNSFVGTEEYVAPEIIQGNGHDFAVDWWSFGVVLYELLYGVTPFRGANRKETFYRILSTTPELVGEMTSLRDLIGKLLIKNPKERISSDEIKCHDFFEGIDWEMILRLSRPPYIPDRPEIGEGVDGIQALEVELIVYGIFRKEDSPNDNDNGDINAKDNNDRDKNSVNDDNKLSNEGEEKIKKGIWVEGLEQASVSNNFLVF